MPTPTHAGITTTSFITNVNKAASPFTFTLQKQKNCIFSSHEGWVETTGPVCGILKTFRPSSEILLHSWKKWMESPNLGLSWGCQKNDLHGFHRMIGLVNFLGPPNFLASYWWFYDEAFQMRGKRLRYQKKKPVHSRPRRPQWMTAFTDIS